MWTDEAEQELEKCKKAAAEVSGIDAVYLERHPVRAGDYTIAVVGYDDWLIHRLYCVAKPQRGLACYTCWMEYNSDLTEETTDAAMACALGKCQYGNMPGWPAAR